MVIDPAFNTTFIIDTIVYKLPHVTEELGQARGLGAGIATTGMISIAERIALGTKLANIENYSNAADQALDIALAENPGLVNELGGLINLRSV
ncbi:MAG: hypothetical protein Q9N32_02315 [Gammaproteobacteria bacterium]|nr:hypothetical protein [Gammaproteobacteria bacterium]